MSTSINVTSGDGDGELLRRLRTERNAQRYQFNSRQTQSRLESLVRSAQQRAFSQGSIRSARVNLVSTQSLYRPAAHRFGGRYAAWQLVCREPNGLSAIYDIRGDEAPWANCSWALQGGVHKTTSFSILYSARLGAEPVEIVLPDLQFNLQQHYNFYSGLNNDDIIYFEASLAGGIAYIIEVYHLDTSASVSGSTLISEQAWCYLRTADLSTGQTTGKVFDLGRLTEQDGATAPGDYPSTGALLAAEAPASPLHSLYDWTTPTYIGFAPPLRPSYGSLAWSNIDEDLRRGAAYDPARSVFYDYQPLHTGDRFFQGFYNGINPPTYTGVRYLETTTPGVPGNDWELEVDNPDRSLRPSIWEHWSVFDRFHTTVAPFAKYLSGQTPLPASGTYANQRVRGWYLTNINARRWAYPSIIPKL
jgi:hypothetical protein